MAFLIEKAEAENLKIILKTELTSDKLAKTIADAVSGEVRELNSAHNISGADFAAGTTYVDILKNNLEVLKVALN